ncbi:MAG: U32 family peptidase C-terminal domain-containing protein [Rhodospirillales bacterium]|nr:U32 family peptidase C-terminal domain-containing protein [Rhodospirillales bacterium]
MSTEKHTPIKSRVPRPKRAELLLPAGNLERLKTAILYGADAIYAGTPDMSLRTASEFSLEQLVEGVEFAHERGKRIYLTLNLFTHNKDIERLPEFLETIRKVQPDGIIVADPGVFQYLKDNAPELERHISTQANVVSWLTVDYWQKQGADLCVLAREASFTELSEIREKCPDIKLEAFVHGAMCMTYSGRCLLSNFMAERGANQGNCAHSCRWKYKLKVVNKDGSEGVVEIDEDNKGDFEYFLEEEFRPGVFYEIQEDDHGSYIMNSKDLCLMPHLDDYLRIGVDSLKIEGRSKSEYYVAVTTRAYRQAIDAWFESPEDWSPDKYLKELYTLQSRGYTLGFHEGRLTDLAHNYDRSDSIGGWQFAGVVREWDGDDLIFEIRNMLRAGDVVEFMPPGEIDCIRLRLYEFEDSKSGKTLEKVSAGQGQAIRISADVFHNEDKRRLKELLPPLTLARKETILSEERRLQLEMDIRAQDVERGLLTQEAFDAWKEGEEAASLKSVKGRAHTGKAPKLGLDGCCGLGCNGCLMFWNDPKYEKAREAMSRKKMGEKLEKTIAS